MAKLWQFSQGHPKPAFSEKVQSGDQGKFFKNRPKSSPPLKGPTAPWRKGHYPLLSNLTLTQIGTKRNVSKIAQKVALA